MHHSSVYHAIFTFNCFLIHTVWTFVIWTRSRCLMYKITFLVLLVIICTTICTWWHLHKIYIANDDTEGNKTFFEVIRVFWCDKGIPNNTLTEVDKISGVFIPCSLSDTFGLDIHDEFWGKRGKSDLLWRYH